MLVEVGRLGVHLHVFGPAYDDVADERHPPTTLEHVMGSPPSNRRGDPMPRGGGQEQVKATTAVIPLLERRLLDLNAAHGLEATARDFHHPRTWLNCRHGNVQGCERTSRLTCTAADFEHQRSVAEPRDSCEIAEQATGVAGTHAIVKFGHLIKNAAWITRLASGHPVIVVGLSSGSGEEHHAHLVTPL